MTTFQSVNLLRAAGLIRRNPTITASNATVLTFVNTLRQAKSHVLGTSDRYPASSPARTAAPVGNPPPRAPARFGPFAHSLCQVRQASPGPYRTQALSRRCSAQTFAQPVVRGGDLAFRYDRDTHALLTKTAQVSQKRTFFEKLGAAQRGGPAVPGSSDSDLRLQSHAADATSPTSTTAAVSPARRG